MGTRLFVMGSAGILPACLQRQKSGRDVRRKAGETPALPARAKRHTRLFVLLIEHGRLLAKS